MLTLRVMVDRHPDLLSRIAAAGGEAVVRTAMSHAGYAGPYSARGDYPGYMGWRRDAKWLLRRFEGRGDSSGSEEPEDHPFYDAYATDSDHDEGHCASGYVDYDPY